MQKWEYCYIELSVMPLGINLNLFINGEQVKINRIGGYDDALQVTNLLNRLGKDGWELVSSAILPISTSGLGSLSKSQWTLKRPLS